MCSPCLKFSSCCNKQLKLKGEDTVLNEQPYRYLTVDEMKSLGDDSLPIDVTRDERFDSNLMMAMDDSISPQHSYNQMSSAIDNIDITKHPLHIGFLVSFLVDARGGAMRGCRHSGVRVIVPPRCAPMPTRVTCRYLRRDKLPHPPPLMEGEALASRILELGPIGAKFLGPVMIEVPHFGSLRGSEREIVILRSDNGETWREHTIDNSEEIIQDILSHSFEKEDQTQLDDTTRITRILTTEFPHYFAVVSRIRQEVHAIGPEGGMVSSSVVPQVQAVFPEGALTKKIKVGLQSQPIPSELVSKLLGNRVAVSPIVTVEPRRRKFHKPITLTIPVPQAASKGMINQYSGDAPTLRLLCSITGGTTRAQWEDVTGSTPLTFVNDCVSFTTTVSARFWLMDCRNVGDATKMATELYREAIHVPFMAKFVVFAKRVEVLEARLRVFCMTDDKEDKTLEHQEHFTEVAKSRDVEVLEGKSQYIEFAGNLVPVTKSGDQLKLGFRAFRENRLPFIVRVKDPHADVVGRILFMREPKVAKGEAPQHPACVLNIVLPQDIIPETGLSVSMEELNKLSFVSSDISSRADLRLSDISNMLDEDWVPLATELGLSNTEINTIKMDYHGSNAQQALTMLRYWYQQHSNKPLASELESALSLIGRNDIVLQCIARQQDNDKSGNENSKVILQNMDYATVKKEKDDLDDYEEKKYVAEEKDVVEEVKKSVQERKEEIEKRLSLDKSVDLILDKKPFIEKRKSLIFNDSGISDKQEKEISEEKKISLDYNEADEPPQLTFEQKRLSFEKGLSLDKNKSIEKSITKPSSDGSEIKFEGLTIEKPEISESVLVEEVDCSDRKPKEEIVREGRSDEVDEQLSFQEKRLSFEKGFSQDKVGAATINVEKITTTQPESEETVSQEPSAEDKRRNSVLFEGVSQGLVKFDSVVDKFAQPTQDLLSPKVAKTPPPSPAEFKDSQWNKSSSNEEESPSSWRTKDIREAAPEWEQKPTGADSKLTDAEMSGEKLSVADKKVEGPSPSLQESKKIRAVHSIAVDVIANKIETNFLKPNLEEQPCSSTVLSVEMCESKKDSKLPEKNVALKMLEPSSVKLSNTLTKDDKIANPEVFENLENNQTSISSEIRTPRNNDSLVPQKENARIIAAERSKIVGKNDAIPELKDIQTSVFLGKEKIPCVSRTFEKYSDVILAPQISQERSHMDTPSSTNGKELEVSESISSKGSPVAGDNDKPKNTSFKVVEKGNKSALKDHVNLQKNVQKIKSKEMPGSEIRSEIPESGNDSKNLDQNPPKEEQIKNGADELEKDIIPSISQSKFYFQNMSEKEKRSTESIESISLSSPTNNSNIVGLSNEKSGISISEIDPNIIETVEGAIQKLDLSKKTVRDDLSESLSQSIFESGTKSLEECKTIVDTFLNHENDPGFGKEVKNNEIFAVSHPDMNTNKLFSSFDKEKKNQFNKENIKLSCETASEVASSLVAESSPVNNDIDSTSSTVHSASENLFLTPAEEAKDFNIENVEAFSNESAKKIPINNFDLPNDEKLTNILIDMLIEQETAKLVASGDISDNDSDDLSETKNENSLKNDYGVDTIIGLSPKNNIPSGSQKYGHAKEKSKTPNLKLNDITEESISLSYDSSFKDYDDLFSNTEIIDDPQLIKNLISDPTSITSISSFTESVSHEKGKLPKPIITTPTLSRRGVGGSQRLARADRPELREIHLRASEEVYSSDDNETYIVEEPLPKRKVKFQLDSTDSSSREKDDDRGDVEIEEISDEEGVDSTEQVLIEPVPENFKERKLRRVEKKFERMASQTLEENKDNGPGVDREFQRMVSQLSNEEVDECLQLWDDGAFTPSDDLVSKETPDEELGEFESLPHEVRQSSASPSMSVASSVLSIQQEILNELTKGTNDVPASIYWSFDTTPTPTPHAIDKNKLNPQQSLSPVIHPIREPCSVNDSPLGYNYRNSALNEESDQQGLKSRGDESKNVEAKPRKLKYDISMDEEIEVDPREHDWRFNLNLPPYSEKEETSGAAASEQSQPSDSRSGGNN